MQKNVKGIIGLVAALLAIVLTIASIVLPTNPIKGTSLALHGRINVYMALGAAALGLIAIIFGIISLKDRDKKGPRKAGIIIGIFAILLGLGAAGLCSFTEQVANYMNGEPSPLFDQMTEEQRADLDTRIEQLKAQYPAE